MLTAGHFGLVILEIRNQIDQGNSSLFARRDITRLSHHHDFISACMFGLRASYSLLFTLGPTAKALARKMSAD
jgi:hypothetical protein